MIKVSIYALSATLILAGCSDSKKADIERNDVPATDPAPVQMEVKEEPKPAATTSTTPDKPGEKSIEPSEPTPKAPEKPAKVAVSGTVWSLGRISLTTDDGIFSVPAGRPLKVVKHTPAGYVVTDGKTQFDVTEAQVSVNPAQATGALQAEATTQAAGAERMRAQVAAVQQKREVSAEADKAEARKRRIRELQAKYDGLVQEETTLRANIRQAESQNTQTAISRANGRIVSRQNTHEAAWNARIAAVQREMLQVMDEMRAAQQQ